MSEFRLILPDNVVRLSADASDDDIFDLVRAWVDALAAEDYERAYEMTAHSSFTGFTPDLIRRLVEGYGSVEADPNNPEEIEDHRNIYRKLLQDEEEAGPSKYMGADESPEDAERIWRHILGVWRQALDDVGKPKPIHKITDWRTAEIEDTEPTHNIRREDSEVWFDLPLDGVWSDLTATFDIRELDDCIVLQLEQIHVM